MILGILEHLVRSVALSGPIDLLESQPAMRVSASLNKRYQTRLLKRRFTISCSSGFLGGSLLFLAGFHVVV